MPLPIETSARKQTEYARGTKEHSQKSMLPDPLKSLWEQACILNHYRNAKNSQKRFPTRTHLEDWQDQQITSFLQRIVPQSPFYREHFAGYKLSDWRTLPTLDKALMMGHFDCLNTVGISKENAFDVALRAETTRDFKPMIGDITIGLSSGTSGHRGLFLVSPQERRRWAGNILTVLPGSLLKRHRIAFFLRANSNLYTSVGSHRIRFAFFDLFDPFDAHIARLQEERPTVLIAPPSMLCLLAQAVQQGRLHLHLEKIISVAEVLEPAELSWLQGVFGQPIHQVYQCTEGFLATTCQYGTLHLNEDLLAIQKEPLAAEPIPDQAAKFTPIITDFFRTTQPIIRYRLNDILTERATPCPCGSLFTAIEAIDGRCDDLFYLPAMTGEQRIPIFPDAVRKAILRVSAPIEDYQVFQLNEETIAVGLSGTISDADETAIRDALQHMAVHHQARIPTIRFQPYQPPEPGSKKRRIQRQFEPQHLEQASVYPQQSGQNSK